MSDVKYWKDKLNSIMIEGRGVARGGGSVTKRTEIASDSPSQSATSSSSPSVPTIPPAAVSDEQMKTLKIPAFQRKSATASSNVSGSTSVPTLPPSNVSQGIAKPVLPSPAARPTAVSTAVSPTLSAATTSDASAKPKIKLLPGETMDQAMARIKSNAPILVTPDEPNVWRDARNPQYAGRGQTQPAAVPVLQPAAAPQPAAGSIQPQSFTRMGDVQKQLDVSAGRGLNTSAQIDPLSMPREPETGYGRPAPATQGSNIKNMLSRLSRLGRSAGDEYSNLYVSPMRSGVASRGTTPVQDRAYITDLQNKLAKNPLDDNLRGELARMQRFYPDEIKETSMSSAAKKSTGPKFPGYWRGNDPASAARSKMVGSVEESVQHRATVLMNQYKNFKAGK